MVQRKQIFLLNWTNFKDTNFNKTARDIQIEEAKIISLKKYAERMSTENNLLEQTLLKTDNTYTNEIIDGRKHVFSNKQKGDKIVLDNNKVFKKYVEPVYPAEFTEWISGVELKPEDKPQMIKPTRGMKRWTNLPELVENVRI